MGNVLPHIGYVGAIADDTLTIRLQQHTEKTAI